MLAYGRWFSPASSTTKTGRHDIAEILLKMALNTKNQLIRNSVSTWKKKIYPHTMLRKLSCYMLLFNCLVHTQRATNKMNPSLIWDDPLSFGYNIIWEMHRDIVTKESPKVPLILIYWFQMRCRRRCISSHISVQCFICEAPKNIWIKPIN